MSSSRELPAFLLAALLGAAAGSSASATTPTSASATALSAGPAATAFLLGGQAVAVDDAILLRAAEGRALPRRLSPPREAALESVVSHFRRDDVERGLADFQGFAAGYFSEATAEDLEPIVLYLLRRGFLDPRPDLLALAEQASWHEDRAIAVAQHLDQLEEALSERRRGQLPPVAPLELGGLEADPFVEPYRWLPGRPMRRSDIERERIAWGRRLVMTQEDAIAARLRLQGRVQAHREAVRRLSRAALALLAAGESALTAAR